MTDEEFCTGIIECLIKYGKLNKADAQLMLSKSNLRSNNSELEWSLLEHEYAYYWAMPLLYYTKNNQWFQNPSLWPPPEDYIEEWHRRRGATTLMNKETGSSQEMVKPVLFQNSTSSNLLRRQLIPLAQLRHFHP